MKNLINYSKPQIRREYTLGARAAVAQPNTANNVTEMLIASADDCGFLYAHVSEWAHDNIEPSDADYRALAEIIKGFGEVMEAAADYVDEKSSTDGDTDPCDEATDDVPPHEPASDEKAHPTWAECMLAEIHDYLKYEHIDPDETVQRIGDLFITDYRLRKSARECLDVIESESVGNDDVLRAVNDARMALGVYNPYVLPF